MIMKIFTAICLTLTLLLTICACIVEAPEVELPSVDVEDGSVESTDDIVLESKNDSPETPDKTEVEESDTAESSEEASVAESSEELTEDTTENITEATTEPASSEAVAPTEPHTEPPHQHSYTSSVVSPTCTSDGYTKYTCSCGKSYTDNYTGATGHSYVDTVVDPTTSSEGYTEHTCSRCGHSYTDSYTEKLKIVYDYKRTQQIGNDYIASLGYTVDPSLPYGVCGYYPATDYFGYGLESLGGQEFLNAKAIENVNATINRLIATEYDGDISGYHLYCEVTYDEANDTYWFCVYYG